MGSSRKPELLLLTLLGPFPRLQGGSRGRRWILVDLLLLTTSCEAQTRLQSINRVFGNSARSPNYLSIISVEKLHYGSAIIRRGSTKYAARYEDRGINWNVLGKTKTSCSFPGLCESYCICQQKVCNLLCFLFWFKIALHELFMSYSILYL